MRKTERLLIADDDPNLLEAYVLFFEAYGYAIQTATDGLGALAAYCVWRPDVVMLDIQMPRMDGRAVAREIRRMNVVSSPLLLAVTALCTPTERAESLRGRLRSSFCKTGSTAGHSGCDSVPHSHVTGACRVE